MPTDFEPDLALLLDFDGTVYVGDLPILSYARHASAGLEPAEQAALIDGLRNRLEGRSTGLSTVDLSAAEDGWQAVELLATAAGVDADTLAAAYAASRDDLAASAFALDAPTGLVELLAGLRGVAWVVVTTDAPATGVTQVLDSLGLAGLVDEVIVEAGKPAGLAPVVRGLVEKLARSGPNPASRLVAVGDRWAADLAATHQAGGATAYIDRFGRGDGQPTWRAAEPAALVPELATWVGARMPVGGGRVGR